MGKLQKAHVAHIRFKMAEHQTSRLLNKQSTVHFCSNCGFRVEKSYYFCPKCGKGIKTIGNVVNDGIVDRKKSLKLHRPTQAAEKANSRCRGLLYQVLAHSNQRRKKNDKVFFRKRVGGETKNEKFRRRKLLFRLA